MRELFGLDLSQAIVGRLKTTAAQIYKPAYDAILRKLSNGHLLHADETKINVAGGSGYVWVFTNLEEVAFYYTETREAEVLQTLFSTFRGVLVSDFYNAYDSMACPQQKCLIHLIRDLNEDLRKQPFNNELSKMVREFSGVMQPIVETIDRFGLKARFLAVSFSRFSILMESHGTTTTQSMQLNRLPCSATLSDHSGPTDRDRAD